MWFWDNLMIDLFFVWRLYLAGDFAGGRNERQPESSLTMKTTMTRERWRINGGTLFFFLLFFFSSSLLPLGFALTRARVALDLTRRNAACTDLHALLTHLLGYTRLVRSSFLRSLAPVPSVSHSLIRSVNFLLQPCGRPVALHDSPRRPLLRLRKIFRLGLVLYSSSSF